MAMRTRPTVWNYHCLRNSNRLLKRRLLLLCVISAFVENAFEFDRQGKVQPP